MNTIIYSRDFEPITNIELPLEVIESAEKTGKIILALKTNLAQGLPSLVEVRCHKMQWLDGSTKSVLVTGNEELALLLRPEWLPGQRAVIKAYERTVKALTEEIKKTKPND